MIYFNTILMIILYCIINILIDNVNIVNFHLPFISSNDYLSCESASIIIKYQTLWNLKFFKELILQRIYTKNSIDFDENLNMKL